LMNPRYENYLLFIPTEIYLNYKVFIKKKKFFRDNYRIYK